MMRCVGNDYTYIHLYDVNMNQIIYLFVHMYIIDCSIVLSRQWKYTKIPHNDVASE